MPAARGHPSMWWPSRWRTLFLHRRLEIKKLLTLEEVYALALKVLSLSILVWGENSNLIILIKGDVHVDLSSLHNLFWIINVFWKLFKLYMAFKFVGFWGFGEHAANRLSVTALIILRSRLPATACMPSDIYFMPSKKIPRPPMTWKRMSWIACHSIFPLTVENARENYQIYNIMLTNNGNVLLMGYSFNKKRPSRYRKSLFYTQFIPLYLSPEITSAMLSAWSFMRR